jgi:hypothetical protein
MTATLQTLFLPFEIPGTPTSHRATRISDEQWTKHRGTIEELYIDQEKTLNEVVEIMKKEHKFHATYVTATMGPHSID